jgi:hypothetical protein
MTVNGPWRICFKFKDGDAYDVEIIDCHNEKGSAFDLLAFCRGAWGHLDL